MQAVRGLTCMEHRGACSADGISGDGAGIMSGIPWGLFKDTVPTVEAEKTGYVYIVYYLLK